MTTPSVSPDRARRVAQALRFFSIAAWVTGVWLLILCTRMVLEYIVGIDMPTWTRITTLNLGVKARWEPVKWITTALAGTIPFLSFVIEAKRRKEVTAAFNL